MNNKQMILNELTPEGLIIGCYDNEMDKLSKKAINAVIEAMKFYPHTDVPIKHKGQDYIVEVATVDNERDFNVISKKDHQEQYGEA